MKIFQHIMKGLSWRPSLTAFLALFLLATLATAGSLTPPGSPASTMNTLEEVFDSIAGVFDSSAIVADQNGSLIEHLKYIEANMGTGGGVASDSLDFDEFVDAMTLDADTTVASAGFTLGIGVLNVGNNQGAFPAGTGGDEPLIINHLTTTNSGDGITSLYTMDPSVGGGVGRAGQFDLFTEVGNAQTFADIEGIQAAVFHQGSGTVTTLNAGSFYPGNDGPGTVSEMNGLSVQIINDGGGSITNAAGLHVSVPFVPSPTGGNIYGVLVDDQSSAGANAWNLYSAGDDSANRFEGHMAIGNEAFIGDLFGGIPGQTLMSLHEQFTDLSTFGISAGTAHSYDLNPTGTATDIIFGEDVFVRTTDTNTEDFTGGIVAGRYYPIHLGSGTVTQMDGLQIQPQTDNGTVTQMRGILVSNNTTGTGDIGDAYAIYVDGPLGVGGITNNYGLFVEDQSGSTGDSYNIFSAGAGTLNVFEGNATVSSDFEVNGHSAMGNIGGIDGSYYNSTIGFTNSSVVAINEESTAPTTDLVHGISSDLIVDLAADNGITSFIGAGNYSTVPVGNTSDVFQLVGAFNSALTYGDGDTGTIVGTYNLGANWGDGTTGGLYGSFNNACNCVEAGNVGNAFSVYSSVHNSSTGTITNAYDLFAEAQFGGGTITNNYGVYIAAQNGLGVVNGYNLYSAGAGTRNIFEGHASIGGNFELTGTVSSNLTPTTDNTYDLGSTTNRWRDLYLASGSLHIGTSGDEAVIDYDVNDDYLSFKPDGSTTRMRITDAGLVGIGSFMALSETLEVGGTASISSDMRVNGNITSPGTSASSEKFGSGAIAVGDESLAVGRGAQAGGLGGDVAIGFGTEASGNYSIAMGYLAKARGQWNVAIGYGALSEGGSGIAIGLGAYTSAGNAVALGNGAQAGGSDMAFGELAEATNSYGLAMGYTAKSRAQWGIAIGYGSIAEGGTAGTAIGLGAYTAAANGVALGTSAQAGGERGVAIGYQAVAAFLDTIAIGPGATTTAAGQFVVGDGDGFGISNVYFGEGVSDVTPLAYTINGTGGSGTDIAGANILIAGGRGTGTGAGGSVSFQTAPAGGSGSSANALVTRMTISSSGNVGIGTTTPTLGRLHVSGGDSYFGSSNIPVKWGDSTSTFGELNYGATSTRVIATSGRPLGLSANGGLDQVFISTTGNLGVGTTAPSAKLAVSGTASVSGNVFMTGLSAAAVTDNFVCRNPTTGELTFGVTCTASSIRFKKNVQDLEHGLDWVRQLRPVTFDWKHNGEPSLGFIAEEVNAVTPLLALYQDGQVYSVNYQIMTSVLAKAVQELDGKIEDLAEQGPMQFNSDSWFEELFTRIIERFQSLLGIGFEEKTICLGETCINEEQLKELMEQGNVPTPESTPEPTPTPEVSPEITPEPEETPELTPEPAEETPVPETEETPAP